MLLNCGQEFPQKPELDVLCLRAHVGASGGRAVDGIHSVYAKNTRIRFRKKVFQKTLLLVGDVSDRSVLAEHETQNLIHECFSPRIFPGAIRIFPDFLGELRKQAGELTREEVGILPWFRRGAAGNEKRGQGA